jgi:hypothetical protein
LLHWAKAGLVTAAHRFDRDFAWLRPLLGGVRHSYHVQGVVLRHFIRPSELIRVRH